MGLVIVRTNVALVLHLVCLLPLHLKRSLQPMCLLTGEMYLRGQANQGGLRGGQEWGEGKRLLLIYAAVKPFQLWVETNFELWRSRSCDQYHTTSFSLSSYLFLCFYVHCSCVAITVFDLGWIGSDCVFLEGLKRSGYQTLR